MKGNFSKEILSKDQEWKNYTKAWKNENKGEDKAFMKDSHNSAKQEQLPNEVLQEPVIKNPLKTVKTSKIFANSSKDFA